MKTLFTPEELARWCEEAGEAYENIPGFLKLFEAEVARRVVAELRPVFESAAKADPRRVSYHARRFGAELVPVYAEEWVNNG